MNGKNMKSRRRSRTVRRRSTGRKGQRGSAQTTIGELKAKMRASPGYSDPMKKAGIDFQISILEMGGPDSTVVSDNGAAPTAAAAVPGAAAAPALNTSKIMNYISNMFSGLKAQAPAAR